MDALQQNRRADMVDCAVCPLRVRIVLRRKGEGHHNVITSCDHRRIYRITREIQCLGGGFPSMTPPQIHF